MSFTRPVRWFAVLAAVGLALTAGAGIVLVRELTRHATPAEASAAGAQELTSRWERLTAGQLFPARVAIAATTGTASRIGIAPATSCAAAFDPTVARVLDKAGCLTTLRATYSDPSGTLLATVGIAVMRNNAAAQTGMTALSVEAVDGIRTVPFPGTIADDFTDQERETTGAQLTLDGPYVLAYAVGYADGGPTTPDTADGETAPAQLGVGLVTGLGAPFTAPGSPCSLKDVRC